MMEVDSLVAGYGRIGVLNGLSLTVEDGACVGVLGHNGMGKTTLLKTVMGLLPASSGTIRLDGRPIEHWPTNARARAGIGYVPQGRGLFAGMTVRENLALGRLARKTDGLSGVVWSEEQILDTFPRDPLTSIGISQHCRHPKHFRDECHYTGLSLHDLHVRLQFLRRCSGQFHAVLFSELENCV